MLLRRCVGRRVWGRYLDFRAALRADLLDVFEAPFDAVFAGPACDSALAATDLLRAPERPSLSCFDAFLATCGLVPLLAGLADVAPDVLADLPLDFAAPPFFAAAMVTPFRRQHRWAAAVAPRGIKRGAAPTGARWETGQGARRQVPPGCGPRTCSISGGATPAAPPAILSSYLRAEDAARAQLPPTAFDAAWSHGRALTPAEAFALASHTVDELAADP